MLYMKVMKSRENLQWFSSNLVHVQSWVVGRWQGEAESLSAVGLLLLKVRFGPEAQSGFTAGTSNTDLRDSYRHSERPLSLQIKQATLSVIRFNFLNLLCSLFLPPYGEVHDGRVSTVQQRFVQRFVQVMFSSAFSEVSSCFLAAFGWPWLFYFRKGYDVASSVSALHKKMYRNTIFKIVSENMKLLTWLFFFTTNLFCLFICSFNFKSWIKIPVQ